MARVYIGIGSNLGNRAQYLRRSIALLHHRGFKVCCQSPIYETAPEGMAPTRNFLNMVVGVDTTLAPVAVWHKLQGIEQELGRPARHRRNQPRTIDLDLLFYGRQVVRQPELEIPHPRLHQRWFVLKPLAALAPGLVHPIKHHRVSTLLMMLEEHRAETEPRRCIT